MEGVWFEMLERIGFLLQRIVNRGGPHFREKGKRPGGLVAICHLLPPPPRETGEGVGALGAGRFRRPGARRRLGIGEKGRGRGGDLIPVLTSGRGGVSRPVDGSGRRRLWKFGAAALEPREAAGGCGRGCGGKRSGAGAYL
jgi:hypothetical protein